MLRNPRSTTYGLMYFMVALSVMGVIVASQQYLILLSEEEVILTRRTLEESFLSAIRRAGGESNPEIAQQLVRRKSSVEDTYSGATAMIAQLKIRALADTIAWCVVLGISGWALIINARMKPKPSDPPAV
jgi:hypothetical protein